MRTHLWALRKRITEDTICTAPQWPAEQDLPVFMCIFSSVHISLGFRRVQFKQHKEHRKQKDAPPPFPLSAALHHFLLGKGNISGKGCSVGICSHKKVCLTTVASRLGLSLPQRCTAASAGRPPARCTLWGHHSCGGREKEKLLQMPQLCPLPCCHLTSLTSVLSAPSPVSRYQPHVHPQESLAPLHFHSSQTPVTSCLL